MDWAAPLAQYLNLGADATTARGDLLNTLGSACQNAVERAIGRTLDVRSYSEYYDGNDKDTLFLRHDPIDSVQSLSINGGAFTVVDPESAGVAAATPAAVISPDRQAITLTGGSVFARRFPQNIAVTYKAGLARTTPDGNVPPPELAMAIVYWAAMLFKDRDRIGHSSITTGQQVTAFTRIVPPHIMQMIVQYRRGFIPTC